MCQYTTDLGVGANVGNHRTLDSQGSSVSTNVALEDNRLAVTSNKAGCGENNDQSFAEHFCKKFEGNGLIMEIKERTIKLDSKIMDDKQAQPEKKGCRGRREGLVAEDDRDLNHDMRRFVVVLIYCIHDQLLTPRVGGQARKIPRAEGLACTYVIIQEQSLQFYHAHVLRPPHDGFTTRRSDTSLHESSLPKGEVWPPSDRPRRSPRIFNHLVWRLKKAFV